MPLNTSNRVYERVPLVLGQPTVRLLRSILLTFRMDKRRAWIYLPWPAYWLPNFVRPGLVAVSTDVLILPNQSSTVDMGVSPGQEKRQKLEPPTATGEIRINGLTQAVVVPPYVIVTFMTTPTLIAIPEERSPVN